MSLDRYPGISLILMTVVAIAAGCAQQRTPMTVEVTQLAPYTHAAKGPECDMPVLSSMPLTNYRQVAIVEAWADLKDKENDVLPALKRRACETGADALVIVNSQHQDVKNMLYQASPNESLNDTTEKNVYAGQGEYLAEMEHTRRLGEAGHNGYYVDAVAIDYRNQQSNKTSQQAPLAPTPPNG